MFFKSLIGFTVILLSSCKDVEIDESSPYLEQYASVIRAHGTLSKCNKTFCDEPCPGAAPPPRCPEVVPFCVTGCACVLDCENGLTICFDPKDCMDKRLYLTGKRGRKNSKDSN